VFENTSMALVLESSDAIRLFNALGLAADV
jgi:hypothetical protein